MINVFIIIIIILISTVHLINWEVIELFAIVVFSRLIILNTENQNCHGNSYIVETYTKEYEFILSKIVRTFIHEEKRSCYIAR